jgi:peptidase MA superfamily protein
MGGLTHRLALAVALAAVLVIGVATPTLAFTGFGPMAADATYGVEMVFSVELTGGAPDRLDLLLRFSDDEATFVAPVTPTGASAEFRWDAASTHVTPNTAIAYRWRATDGDRVTLSPERTLLYDDDRPGLDWHSARIGDATVHWYGGAEARARRFGELSAGGASRAEALFGHQLAGPVDIFVYDSREDFFGALGPGAREWTGAATYPPLRTIFMWLGGGSTDYLETTIVHEVTHVVFHDATDNPYHEPAKWLNEGLAVWSEQRSAAQQRSTVEFEASGGGLFAFQAIADQFPIGTRGSSLSYAQGATMIGMIIDRSGEDAIAGIAAAYREGASDDEALEAGTGVPAEQLYAEFYAEFGVDPPQPIEPAPILPSNVRTPGGRGGGDGAPAASSTPQPSSQPGGQAVNVALLVVPVILLVAAGVAFAAWTARRSARRREAR